MTEAPRGFGRCEHDAVLHGMPSGVFAVDRDGWAGLDGRQRRGGAARVPRATAQRYLGDLAADGRVEVSLRYGSTGRPEHRYGLRDPA